MTKGHLYTQQGIRGHSAGDEFARTGIVRFSMGMNPTVRMVKFPDGREMTEEEFESSKIWVKNED